MPTNITLKGFDQFQRKLSNLPKQLREEVDEAVQDAGDTWALRAASDAPNGHGHLSGQIKPKKLKDMVADVTVPVEYAPYIEWGTKTRVKVPAELQGYAAQFRGGKGGGNAKQMIYAWMDRVGVPKDKHWIVFISIITRGIHPHPFFFIQRPIVEKQLIGDIKAIISTER